MTRISAVALAALLAVSPILSGPALAGITFDLPNLTWPEAPPAPQDGAVVLGTKSVAKP